jgi:hypothetical protein
MNYVARRIQITKSNGETETISDEEFSHLTAPLVLLGEPGAGKTETAQALAKQPGRAYFSADLLATGAPAMGLSGCIPVIDGLDEAQSDDAGSPLLAILKRLESINIPSFVLTCRAVDWANVQNERSVENWFGRKPVVGHLQPLDDDEVVAMVDAIATYPLGGKEFLKEAENKNAVDLARNPQALRLLLAAISENGWPDTKTELYEHACASFAGEKNEVHMSLHRERPGIDAILSAAGFISAQLLLSGKRGVNIDGRDDRLFPRLADLASGRIATTELEPAVASLLFRSSGIDTIEPYHRTIAEFLGARWLSASVRSGFLSMRRLEALLYKNGAVPGPLRGLHAWLATLDRGMTDRFVTHDPYGCFRYGDVDRYTTEQARHLIAQLQNLAAIDPHFRSQDWGGQVGKGLARAELRGEILGLIQNPEIPYQLSTVVLESLNGSVFASTIREDLRHVVLNESMAYVARDRALTALEFNNLNEDWPELAGSLIKTGEHGSARMAVEVAIGNVHRFEGTQLASIMLAFHDANERSSLNLALGTELRLLPRMSLDQLYAAISAFAGVVPTKKYQRTSFERTIEDHLLKALQIFLERGGSADAVELWNWLRHVTRYQYRSQDWNTFSVQYFDQRPELRRAIQALVLDQATPEERWPANFRLGEMASGLSLHESDVAFHLESLVIREPELTDVVHRWRQLVEWTFVNQSFAGMAEVVAREQAKTRPEFQAIIDEIVNRPPPAWEREEKTRQKRQQAESRRQSKARYQDFAAIREQLRDGLQLDALHSIASAYIGLYTEVNDIDDPVKRIEWLVGSENLEAALQGLIAACFREDLPSPRDIATLDAEESKEYFLARIVLVGCALSGGKLIDMPRRTLLCALTACRWGLYSQERYSANGLEETLTELLFQATAEMIQFVRDVIEPHLFTGKAHVPGLYQVLESKEYEDVALELASDWLQRASFMSGQALRHIFPMAIARLNRSEISDLIAVKLESSDWPDEEHRQLWHAAAFFVDFERFEYRVRSFAGEGPTTLSQFRSMPERKATAGTKPLSVRQLCFIIETYSVAFPLIEPRKSGWGENEPYENARFVTACVTGLGEILTDEAQQALVRLVTGEALGSHNDHARHVLAEHTRAMAEADWSNRTLNEVRHILLAGEPQTIEDLQALVMDELEAMQDRIANGSFNAVRPFWDNQLPHTENYCRDLIAGHLEPYLERLGVRTHTEGTMPDDKRCDLLCTIGALDLPIEIKGQWHNQVWTAATRQLEDNYGRHYRASGRGIYLVLWFGNVAGMNPPGIREHGRPENAQAMLEAIPARSPAAISEKTALFVLDASSASNFS